MVAMLRSALKELAACAGIDTTLVSGHSLHPGLATTAATTGRRDRKILVQSRDLPHPVRLPRPMDAPYREAPQTGPLVALHEVTAPLGVGRGAAAALLLVGLAGAGVTQATEFECIRVPAGADCKLTTHRAYSSDERAVDGPAAALPPRGVYYDGAADMWRDDDRLADTARAFFRDGTANYFAVLHRPGGRSSLACALSRLAPLAGVAALLFAERRTRVVALTIDPAGRVARARSVGLGGPAVDRESPVGGQPRLRLTDEPAAPYLPVLRVASEDGASPPLLVAHNARQRPTFDRLVARANRALAEGAHADRSPSLGLRLAPSALLVLASLGLFVRVATFRGALPPITGTIALTSGATRCALDGMTLLPGGHVEWEAPVGLTTRTLDVTTPDGARRAASVIFAVRPGARTTFDCALVTSATARLWVTPYDVRTDDIPGGVPRE